MDPTIRPTLMKGNQTSFPCDVRALSCSKIARCILDLRGRVGFFMSTERITRIILLDLQYCFFPAE